jgi:endogenous inhibitor of DNA gyrase (YacG/DUF329 family)
MTTATCPACGTTLPPDFEATAVGGEAEETRPTYRCPNCHTMLTKDDDGALIDLPEAY